MSNFITLPTPLSSTAITLGQLITDPFQPEPQPQQPSTKPHNISSSPRPTMLPSPKSAFNALRRSTSTQTLLRNSAHQNTQLYYVTAIQTSALNTPAKDSARTHVRRVDSASSLPVDDKSTMITSDESSVCAVQLRKVRARVGSPSAPHSVDDTEYEWSYHVLDGDADVQLAIGLGGVVREEDVRRGGGLEADLEHEDVDMQGWDESEDDGLGGF
ncbi:hypothetical protein FB567DRAFT_115611 [Paraphoma chrysanthemicola]|uniref:Uncharacterized protein n=1 Tax=Paraphoma chrysanthemicola TaxID=798071 RepID=A0A8K0VVE8_9PLEO|nr:hypothetical protein FB567DRAFT_115611 [Paraphoma chrysanthemicola]